MNNPHSQGITDATVHSCEKNSTTYKALQEVLFVVKEALSNTTNAEEAEQYIQGYVRGIEFFLYRTLEKE